jgi:hypothetical protein
MGRIKKKKLTKEYYGEHINEKVTKGNSCLGQRKKRGR